MSSTLGDRRDSAVICRERGWVRGTRLVGDEGYGPTVIQITAVGDRSILARAIEHNGKPDRNREGMWVLWCRDWAEVPRCPCAACDEERRQEQFSIDGSTIGLLSRYMILCPECGNKRCPHANHHDNPCTGSNESGQPGSGYPGRSAATSGDETA